MRNLLTLSLTLLSLSAIAQNDFFATQSGAWNIGTTWGGSCTGSCGAGTDYPGPNDNAYTEGYVVRVPSGSFSVNNLYVAYNVQNGINKTLGTTTLTIRGQLASYDPALFDFATPTTNIVNNSQSSWTIQFTGDGLATPTDPVIISWSNLAPLRAVTFNHSSSSGTIYTDGLTVASGGSLIVVNGTLSLNPGQVIQYSGTSATITVNSGATLNLQGAVNGDGTSSSRFPTVTVDGILATGAEGYVNATNFNLGSGATLNVGFNGPDQTQGWWHQSTFPTSASISNTSTINYNASAVQNIHATTYGNLSLNSGSAVTKSLVGSGLAVQGNLVVASNVTFAPASQVDFNGSGAQSISGGGTLSFAGGVEVNKATGTLSLSKDLSINGVTVTAGTLDLGNVTTTLSGGNFINSGTVTSGSAGMFTVSGTSTFSGSGSLTLNNLSVSGSASFNSSAISLTGNISNTGAISFAATSTVTFSGGLNQAISGSAFSIGNMVVNKTSSTLSNDGNVELLGVLTLTTGTFDADGSGGSGVFTLNSDTNGDAAIGQMSGGSITGEVTFERYFNNTNNRWRNIAFPVSSVTFAELGSSITLTSNSLGTYTESTLGNADQGWNIVSSGTLNSRLGHSAYMYNVAPITISVKGPLLQNVPSTSGSPYDYQVTYTDDPAQPSTEDGWNFIPNPYASPISWNAGSGWTKTRVNTAAAVWDAQNGVYQYSNIGWDGVIPQGQSFWVQTNAGSPLLTSTESVKVADATPGFYRLKSSEATESSRLLITLSDSKNADKALIQFRKGATAEFDTQYDATKLSNLIFNLSSLSPSGLNLAANVLPKASCSHSIKLNLTNIKAGNYHLKFDGISSFADGALVTVVDHFMNVSKTIAEGESLTFSVDENPKSFGSERFEVKFSFPDTALKTPEITVSNRKLVSNYSTGNQWLYNGEAIPGATESSLTATKIGAYQLEVNVNGCVIVSSSVQILPGSSRVFPNPAEYKMTVDVSGLDALSGYIYIFTLSGDIVLKDAYNEWDKSKEIFVSSIKPGIYLLKILSAGERVLMEERIVIRR